MTFPYFIELKFGFEMKISSSLENSEDLDLVSYCRQRVFEQISLFKKLLLGGQFSQELPKNKFSI